MRSRALALSLIVGVAVMVAIAGCEQAGERLASSEDMQCSVTCSDIDGGKECLVTCEGSGGKSECTVMCDGATGDDVTVTCDHNKDGGTTCTVTCDGKTYKADCAQHAVEGAEAVCPHHDGECTCHTDGAVTCPGTHGDEGCPAASAGGCPGAVKVAEAGKACPGAATAATGGTCQKSAAGGCPMSVAATPKSTEGSTK